jgi:hypothetical protein
LGGFAPALQSVILENMFTTTQEVQPVSFIDAFVEANEEVQAYRMQAGGPMTVTIRAEIYLEHLAPGQEDAILAERLRVRPNGTFSVLDGVRICPEGISFRVFIASQTFVDDTEFRYGFANVECGGQPVYLDFGVATSLQHPNPVL